MRFLSIAVLAASLALLASPLAAEQLPDGLYADFITPHGVITAELYYTQAPLTCVNFTGLAEGTLAPKNGQPFYTGLTFYRVVPGFVIQSGNPGLKDTDDEKVPRPHQFADEFVPGLRHDAAGVLSMANAGPDTNSCEFFLTLAPTDRLNYLHSVFGRVVRGLAILPQIKPNEAFTIKIQRVGPAAQAFKNDGATFRALAAAAKKYAGTLAPSPTAHFDDPAHLLPQEIPRAKNFNFKLANFERVTGLKIAARLFAKSPTAAEDNAPGAFMQALAQKLGTAQRGAVAAYFADEDDWRVWIGTESTPTFFGQPTTPADLKPEGAFHQKKEIFLAQAAAAGDAAFAQQKKNAAADQPPPAAQHLKLRTDALLDSLIFKLEPSIKFPSKK